MQQNSKNSFELQSQTRILIEEEDNLEAQNTNTNSKFSRKKKIICISLSVSIFLILFFGGLFLILDLLKFQDKITFNNKNAEIHFHQQDYMGLRVYGSAPKDSSFLRIKKLVCELKNKDGQEMGGLTLDFENQINEGQSEEDPNRSFDLFGKFQPDYRKFENLRNFIAHLMIDSSQTLKISCDTAVSAEIYGFIPITIPHSIEFEHEIKIDEQLAQLQYNEINSNLSKTTQSNQTSGTKQAFTNPIQSLNYNELKILFSIDNKDLKEKMKNQFDSFLVILPEVYYSLQSIDQDIERRLELKIQQQQLNLVQQDNIIFNFSMECLINEDKSCSMISPFSEMQEQMIKLHQEGKPLSFQMKSQNSNFLSKVISEDHQGFISKERQYNTALGGYVNCTVVNTSTGIKGNTCNAFSLDKIIANMNIEFQAKPIIMAQFTQTWSNEKSKFYFTNGVDLKILNIFNVNSNVTFNQLSQTFQGKVSYQQQNSNIYDFKEIIQGNYDFTRERVLFNLTGEFDEVKEKIDQVKNLETNFKALLDVDLRKSIFKVETSGIISNYKQSKFFNFQEYVEGSYNFNSPKIQLNLKGNYQQNQYNSVTYSNFFRTIFTAFLTIDTQLQSYSVKSLFNYTNSNNNIASIEGKWQYNDFNNKQFQTNGNALLVLMDRNQEHIRFLTNYLFQIQYFQQPFTNNQIKTWIYFGTLYHNENYYFDQHLTIIYPKQYYNDYNEYRVNVQQQIIWRQKYISNFLGNVSLIQEQNQLQLNIEFINSDENLRMQQKGKTNFQLSSNYWFSWSSINAINVNSFACNKYYNNYYDLQARYSLSEITNNLNLYLVEQTSNVQLGLNFDWNYNRDYGTQAQLMLSSYLTRYQRPYYSLKAYFDINTLIQVLNLNVQEQVSQTIFQEQIDWLSTRPQENFYYGIEKFNSRSTFQQGRNLHFVLQQNFILDQQKQTVEYIINEYVSGTINSVNIKYEANQEDKFRLFVHEKFDTADEVNLNATFNLDFSRERNNFNFTQIKVTVEETVYKIISKISTDLEFNFQKQFSSIIGNLTSMTSQNKRKFYEVEANYNYFEDNFHGDETFNYKLDFDEKVFNLISNNEIYLVSRNKKGKQSCNLDVSSSAKYQNNIIYDATLGTNSIDYTFLNYYFSENVYNIVNTGTVNVTQQMTKLQSHTIIKISDFLRFKGQVQFNGTINFNMLAQTTLGQIDVLVREFVSDFKTKGNTSWDFENQLNQGVQLNFLQNYEGQSLINLHLTSFYNLFNQDFYLKLNETVNHLQTRGTFNWKQIDGLIFGLNAIANLEGTVYFNSTIDFNFVDSKNKLSINLLDQDNIGKNVKCRGLDDKKCLLYKRFDGYADSHWQNDQISQDLDQLHLSVGSQIVDIISINLKGNFINQYQVTERDQRIKVYPSVAFIILETKDPQDNINLFANTTTDWVLTQNNNLLKINLNSLMGPNKKVQNQFFNVNANFDLNTLSQDIKLDVSESINQIKSKYVANYNTNKDGFQLNVLGTLKQQQSQVFDANFTFDLDQQHQKLSIYFTDQEQDSKKSIIKAHTKTSWEGDYQSKRNPLKIIEDLNIQYQNNDILKIFLNAELMEHQNDFRQLVLL